VEYNLIWGRKCNGLKKCGGEGSIHGTFLHSLSIARNIIQKVAESNSINIT
jgi:hypothetical protein